MQLLKIRYYQLKRDLSYWVIIIAVLLFFVAKLISAHSLLYSWGFTGSVLALLYLFHVSRKDTTFALNFLKQGAWQMAVNYSVTVIPISIGFLVTANGLCALVLQLGVIGMAFLKPSITSLRIKTFTSFIPPQHFEWISGLRKQFYLLLLLLLLACILSPVKLFATVGLFLLNTSLLSFYILHEPLLMLNPKRLSVTDFLKEKIQFAIKVIAILNIPILLVNSFFQPDVWVFNLVFLLGFFALTAATIHIKYADYTPNETIGFKIDFLILYAGIFLPYVLLIGIFILISNRKKAMINLNYYLND